jgi:hypothetical protein
VLLATEIYTALVAVFHVFRTGALDFAGPAFPLLARFEVRRRERTKVADINGMFDFVGDERLPCFRTTTPLAAEACLNCLGSLRTRDSRDRRPVGIAVHFALNIVSALSSGSAPDDFARLRIDAKPVLFS